MESAENLRPRSSRIKFAEFAFDAESGDLRKGAEGTRLSRQPAIVLRLLTEHAGEVVTRAEIQEALWGSSIHVDFEQGINWCVREIRKALGDDASNPRFITSHPCRTRSSSIAREGSLFHTQAWSTEAVLRATSRNSSKNPTGLRLISEQSHYSYLTRSSCERICVGHS